MTTKCRCDSKPCAGGCPCSKAGNMCLEACHGGKVSYIYIVNYNLQMVFIEEGISKYY